MPGPPTRPKLCMYELLLARFPKMPSDAQDIKYMYALASFVDEFVRSFTVWNACACSAASPGRPSTPAHPSRPLSAGRPATWVGPVTPVRQAENCATDGRDGCGRLGSVDGHSADMEARIAVARRTGRVKRHARHVSVLPDRQAGALAAQARARTADIAIAAQGGRHAQTGASAGTVLVSGSPTVDCWMTHEQFARMSAGHRLADSSTVQPLLYDLRYVPLDESAFWTNDRLDKCRPCAPPYSSPFRRPDGARVMFAPVNCKRNPHEY